MAIERRRVGIGDADLELFLGAGPAPVLCAAHPADAFGEGTVGLLQAAARRSVVCVNPRGLGGSSPLASPKAQALEQVVDDVEAARRRLGLGAWVFWGMSGGGWLGQIYARRHPGAVAGLILESCCACFRVRLADPTCLLSPFHPSWRTALAERGWIAFQSHAEQGDPSDTEWVDVEGVGSVFRRPGGPALLVSPLPPSPEMRRAMPALWATDHRRWLGTLRLPTLVICGSSDPIVPLAHARSLHEGIEGSELLVVEGGGHVPVVEGRSEVADAVQRFLRDRVG